MYFVSGKEISVNSIFSVQEGNHYSRNAKTNYILTKKMDIILINTGSTLFGQMKPK